jgi:hypothetical protein
MFETKSVLKADTITIEYTDASTNKVQEVATFKSTPFIKEHSVSQSVFESIYSLYLIKIKPMFEIYKAFDDEFIEEMFKFIATGNMFHVEQNTFYYKGNFEYSICPYPDLRELKSGENVLSVELNGFDGDLVIKSEPKDFMMGRTSCFHISDRYTLKMEDIYKALRRYSNISATPQSIVEVMVGNLPQS